MEIRTCEEYVLKELEEAQKEVLSLEDELSEAYDKIEYLMSSLNELKELLVKISVVDDATYTTGKYVGFSSIYEGYSKEQFDTLVRLVPEIFTK